MNKDDIIQKVAGRELRYIGFTQGIFLLTFVSTPFVWMWADWSLAWRVGLSGLIGVILLYGLYEAVKAIIGRQIDEEINKNQR